MMTEPLIRQREGKKASQHLLQALLELDEADKFLGHLADVDEGFRIQEDLIAPLWRAQAILTTVSQRLHGEVKSVEKLSLDHCVDVSEEERICKSCRWWYQDPETTAAVCHEGECRVSGPIFDKKGCGGPLDLGMRQWPITLAKDFCGKWESLND